MPGFTGLNFFIVIFQYLSMTQHLLVDAAAILSSGTMKSPECVAQFVRLSLHQIALLRFLLTALLLPSLIHTSQFLICVSLSLTSPCVFTSPLFTPSLFTPPSPLYFDMHLLTPSFSLLYICRLYISTAPLYRALSHTQHLYVSLSVSLSTSGFGRRKTAD